MPSEILASGIEILGVPVKRLTGTSRYLPIAATSGVGGARSGNS
ncbi:hypothetical protein [Aquimarina spinulae]|nr:hypothetical protein [Aquimarina spinulae]